MGEYYLDSGQITAIALQRMGKDSIPPRILKAQEEQQQRTRKHGEVQTPAWLCCRMNDYLDETWFERENVFNVQDGQTWAPAEGKIVFPKHRHASWRQYIDSRRLEITCGEAPFIVSRYDAATGKAIPIERRIGLLDRKLRIVGENTDSEAEWVKWAIRAVESVYGYEYQGDNLLIARINVLMTFVEYLQSMWHREPTEKELATVANVISWNFWQMDGLTGTVPKGQLEAPEARPITMEELGWFEAIDNAKPLERPQEQETTPPCRICNWRQVHTVTFDSLKTHRGRDVRNMKFDFAIGNPPYQDETLGENKGFAPPVYHLFLEAAYQVSDVVEMIHPSRFLFNAGSTPKAWNRKMLDDPHLKILFHEQKSEALFPGTEIKGGVVISYRNATKDFGAIQVYAAFPELNAIRLKVQPYIREGSLANIIYTQTRFDLEQLFTDHPEYRTVIGSGGKDRRFRNNIFEKIPLFTENPTSADDIMTLGVLKNKRCYRYIPRRYVDFSHENLTKWKALIPRANGSGALGEVMSTPTIGAELVGYTQTFIGIGAFDTKFEAESALKYTKTNFCRTMLGILKITQDNDRETWRCVPLQDFTPTSDIDWAQPIPAIDQQLYRKYGLTDEEIAFIESHVKEMT